MGCYRCSLIYLIVSGILVYKCCQAAGENICGSSQKLPCDNSECISRDAWCDGEKDCSDESDEKYCKKAGWFSAVPDNHCTNKHFTCANGPCIPAVARCDKFDDCSDYSDEDDCEAATTVANLGSSASQSVEIPQDNTTFGIYDDDDDEDVHERPITRPTSTTTVSSTARTMPTTTLRSTTSTVSSIFPPYTSFYQKKWDEESVKPSSQWGYYPHVNGQYHPIYNGQNQNARPISATSHPRVNYRSQTSYSTYNNDNRGYVTAHTTNNHYGQNQNGQTGSNGQRPHSSYPSSRGSDTVPSQLYPVSEQSTHQAVYPPRRTSVGPDPLTFRNGYDSPRTARNSYVQRQRPTLIQPRTVLHPPNPRHLHYALNKAENSSLPPFHFAKNFTAEIGYRYLRNIDYAKQWLISRRNRSYTWGDDTPKALVALSLTTNSFKSDIAENDYMKKGLQTHLGITLLRSRTQGMSVTTLAGYINSLLATCQNPRDFLGLDLVDELYKRRYEITRNETAVAPLVHLTLCLSNRPLLWQDVRSLLELLLPRYPDDVSKDKHILATTALACILQQNYDHDSEVRRSLSHIEERINEAVYYIISQRYNDGSFGSIRSTAIAAQALMSVNSTQSLSWDFWTTLDYLAQQQLDDGSFGDMLSTYFILPVLSGRSLLHLRNTRCDQAAAKNETLSPVDLWNLPGPRKNVLYSVAIGYPERISFAMHMNVPQDLSVIDIMLIAEFIDPRFRFSYKASDRRTEVFSISGVPNDPERRLHWNLYLLDFPATDLDLSRRNEEDIKRIVPQNGQEFLFWYLQSD